MTRHALPVSGQRLAAGVCLSLLLPIAATAQTDGDMAATIRTCQQIEAMSSRLACYDRAFPPESESSEAPGATARSAAENNRDRSTDASESRVRESRAAEARTPMPRPTAQTSQPATQPAPASPAREASAAAGAAAANADDAANADASVSIVSVRELRPRHTVFYAEDGRVFDQTSGPSHVRTPETPFMAAIEAGAFGATFLKLPDDGPRIRVSLRD